MSRRIFLRRAGAPSGFAADFAESFILDTVCHGFDSENRRGRTCHRGECVHRGERRDSGRPGGARMDVAAGHDAVAHGARAGKAGGPGGRAGWSMGKRHVACIAPVVFRLTRVLWELFWRTGFSAGLRLVLAMFWGTFRGESDIARGGGLLWIFMAGACFLLFFRFLLLLLIFWQRTKGEFFVQKEEDFPYWIGRANVKPCQYTKAEKETFGRVSQDIMDGIPYIIHVV